MPSFAASHERSPNDRMWLKMRLKPPLIWLMVRSEKMWVSDMGDVAPVVSDVLRAGEGAGFCKSGRAAGDEVGGLIVAETSEDGVLAGEGVIQTNVEFSFVEFPHRNIGKIEARARCDARGVGNGVEPGAEHDLLRDRIDQGRREAYCKMLLAAWVPLAATGFGVSRAIAHERIPAVGPDNAVRIEQYLRPRGQGYAKQVCGEVACSHGEPSAQSR